MVEILFLFFFFIAIITLSLSIIHGLTLFCGWCVDTFINFWSSDE